MNRLWKTFAVLIGAFVLAAMPALAGDASAAAGKSAAQSDDSGEAKRLRESLIYSVDRTPERTFDTSRADEVITSDDIRRMNPRGLADLLEEHAGVAVSSWHSGGAPIIRGLSGKQVMILIDGVKVNNATWGSDLREYLNIVDLSQVDRVEIVRGVVSVLGTESLGGVINIITKKGSPQGQTFGGSIAARYDSGDSSMSGPIEVFGSTAKLRYDAGFSYGTFKSLRAGDGIGVQDNSSYKQRGGHLNGQWLLSPDKTVGFGYQNVDQSDVLIPALSGVYLRANSTPKRLQLANVSYQDLTSRGWEDSLRVTGYWNRQSQIVSVTVLPNRPNVDFIDGQVLGGMNVELGTFAKSQHFVYGIDYTTESADSAQRTFNPTTGAEILSRGQQMDGSKYRSTALYAQDRFDPTRWLTVTAGARYGTFRTSGDEVSTIGPISLDSSKSGITGALNLIGHATQNLNVIANAFRGFRAPNLNDMSRFTYRTYGLGLAFEVPNPSAEPERVTSYEAGLKYASGNASASAFLFHNKLTNLLTIVPGTYNGVPFLDNNHNGVRDKNEFPIVQNRNVGSANIEGYELEGRYALPHGISTWAHYSRTTGTDTVADQPLAGIPGGFGATGVRFTPEAINRPWMEVVWRYQQHQGRVAPTEKNTDLSVTADGRPGFSIFSIRTGVALTSRFNVTMALENVLNERYRQAGSLFYGEGRNFVLGTQVNF